MIKKYKNTHRVQYLFIFINNRRSTNNLCLFTYIRRINNNVYNLMQ